MAELTISNRKQKDGLSLETVLDDLHEARKMILEASKDWIAKVKQAGSAREAGEALKEGTESLLSLFEPVQRSSKFIPISVPFAIVTKVTTRPTPLLEALAGF